MAFPPFGCGFAALCLRVSVVKSSFSFTFFERSAPFPPYTLKEPPVDVTGVAGGIRLRVRRAPVQKCEWVAETLNSYEHCRQLLPQLALWLRTNLKAQVRFL